MPDVYIGSMPEWYTYLHDLKDEDDEGDEFGIASLCQALFSAFDKLTQPASTETE